ncbi:MAG TPA: hypothetical protein VE733_15285 [Streptosporangiaceae bacterium]|nr:hypothetical protein [Streptosporangiaceae bacterium]
MPLTVPVTVNGAIGDITATLLTPDITRRRMGGYQAVAWVCGPRGIPQETAPEQRDPVLCLACWTGHC